MARESATDRRNQRRQQIRQDRRAALLREAERGNDETEGNAIMLEIVNDKKAAAAVRYCLVEQASEQYACKIGPAVSEGVYGDFRNFMVMNNLTKGRFDFIMNPRPLGSDSSPPVVTVRDAGEIDRAQKEYEIGGFLIHVPHNTRWRVRLGILKAARKKGIGVINVASPIQNCL